MIFIRSLEVETTTSFSTRFVQTNTKERKLIINGQENNNTNRKMASCVKVCYMFLKNIKPESGEIEIISPNELNPYLQEFFIGLREGKSKRRKVN